jgi:hypothetical protein
VGLSVLKIYELFLQSDIFTGGRDDIRYFCQIIVCEFGENNAMFFKGKQQRNA